MSGLRSVTLKLVLSAFMLSSIAAPAQAALVGTEQMIGSTVQAGSKQRVEAFMSRAEVREQLQAWGVEPQEAAARVAALSDQELDALARHIDELPAGGGLIEVIGIVFVVLLILELVGVTNIFTRI